MLSIGRTTVLLKSVHIFNGNFNVGKGGVGTSQAEGAAWVGVEVKDTALATCNVGLVTSEGLIDRRTCRIRVESDDCPV